MIHHLMFLDGYIWDWTVVFSASARTRLALGAQYTLLVSSASLAIGTCIGLVAAIVRTSERRWIGRVAYIYVDFFRTTPALVQIFWVFYVFPILLGISLSAVAAGIIALGLNSGAFLSEIFRAGLVSIGKPQRDAAQVLGLTRMQALRHVILPQALRRVLPATGNVFISLVKDSSLLSVIAVFELTYQTQAEVSQTFRPLELYTALAVVYFVLTYPLSLATAALERRFRVT